MSLIARAAVPLACLLAACAGSAPPPTAPSSIDIPPAPVASSTAPPSAPPVDDNVTGQTWAFCGKSDRVIPGVLMQRTVTFEAGGAVTFKDDGVVSNSCGAAAWKQDGAKVTFDCNGFTEFDATISADAMKGEWHRLKGMPDKGNTCLKRQ